MLKTEIEAGRQETSIPGKQKQELAARINAHSCRIRAYSRAYTGWSRWQRRADGREHATRVVNVKTGNVSKSGSAT